MNLAIAEQSLSKTFKNCLGLKHHLEKSIRVSPLTPDLIGSVHAEVVALKNRLEVPVTPQRPRFSSGASHF